MTADLKELAAVTALNDMMGKGWFSICTIDNVGQMLGRNPRGEAYDILRSLHCIHFDKMPPALRDEIPRLIEQCLNCAPTHRFATVQQHRVIDITPPAAAAETPREEAPRRGLMRLLWGGR